MRKHALSTFVINVLIHIYQKKKIAPEIAGKIASVNGPLRKYSTTPYFFYKYYAQTTILSSVILKQFSLFQYVTELDKVQLPSISPKLMYRYIYILSR